MIRENNINVLEYSFHHDLNTAEPKIDEILPSMPQPQFSVASIPFLSTSRLEYYMIQNNYDQHIIV